jgi:hypothetical protein
MLLGRRVINEQFPPDSCSIALAGKPTLELEIHNLGVRPSAMPSGAPGLDHDTPNFGK